MRIDLSRREFDPATVELMDVVGTTGGELVADLASLRQLNRWFGSYRLIEHYLKRLIRPGSRHRFLDLCTGSGDIPRLMVDWCRRQGVEIQVDAWDFQEATLEVARSLSVSHPEIRYERHDVTAFPEMANYSGVFCSLALHHFAERDAVEILRRMRAVSTHFALVADLERAPLTWWGVRFITSTVFRDPMTVHDALLSVRRAFSWKEMAELAEAAGWSNLEHRRFLYGRQAILLTKPGSAG